MAPRMGVVKCLYSTSINALFDSNFDMHYIAPMGFIEKLQKSQRRKRAIVKQFLRGKRQSDLARKYGLHRQHIHIILKQAGVL